MNKRWTVWVVVLALTTLMLSACGQAGPERSLEGTSWTLFAYRKTSPIEGTTITATFEEGRVYGSAGCNSYSGLYEVDGDKITVTTLGVTMMACMEPQGLMEQEAEFTKMLGSAQAFKFDGDQLLVYFSDQEALTFVPAE